MTTNEANAEPSRAEIDAQRGPLVIEFGTPTCGYCRSAQPAIAQALGPHPELQHIKITDGRGRRLGRSFRVKLWPTLICMRDGVELARVVRPRGAAEIEAALRGILGGTGSKCC